jgi:predicted dehydrogenase
LDAPFQQTVSGTLEVQMGGKSERETLSDADGFPMRHYQAEFEHFAECIATRSEPICSGRDALNDLAVVDAVLEAARTGARVPVQASPL